MTATRRRGLASRDSDFPCRAHAHATDRLRVQKGVTIMRWMFLALGAGAAALLLAMGSQYGTLAAFAALGVSFTTFCLQYDDPVKRARHRIADRLRLLSTGGAASEEYQRLQNARLIVTDADRQVRYTTMTWLNFAGAAASIGLLIWGVMLWLA